MKTQFDILELIPLGEIKNELDFEKALIADRKLRVLSKENPKFKTIRKKLRDLIEVYENKNWSPSGFAMNEQNIKDLGFEIQREKVEASDSEKDWYYYILNIGDICLISSDNEEAIKEGWYVSIFEFQSCVIKNYFDLKTLIGILKNNTPLK